MSKQSHWRTISRRVIRETLDALPPGTDHDAKRKAVSAAYPFREREMHPYRCWLIEVRLALGKARLKKDPPPATVRVAVDTSSGGAVPRVECGWCRSNVDREWRWPGCLSCAQRRHEVASCRETTDWRAWADWARLVADDPSARPAFADWLEENGWPEDAALVRRGG